MTDRESEQRTILESEMIFGVSRRERRAWTVASGSVLVALISVTALVLMVPLKTSVAHVAMVDKATGAVERTVQIERASIEHTDAVKQSLLFNYVMDRETYDAADNERRILKAYRQSAGTAQESLRSLWTEGHPNYPIDAYGATGTVRVEIHSITPVNDQTSTVRFSKTLSRPGEDDRIGNFYATVTYQFVPARQSALELVWENPFGFTVTDYRISAETLEAQQMMDG